MPGFLSSKAWRNILVAVAATSFGQASIAAAQDADFIDRRRAGMPPGVGLIVGSGVNIYLADERMNHLPNHLNVPTAAMMFNSIICEIAAPYFEGNRQRTLAWCAGTLGSFCTVLAACITPTTQPVPLASHNLPKNRSQPTFTERFTTLQTTLNNLIEAVHKNDSKCSSQPLDELKKLQSNMETFEKKHCDFNLALMNDPVTLPESGITYDRANILNHIAQKPHSAKCPLTGTVLDASLKKIPAINIERKNTIDEGLNKFSAELTRLTVTLESTPPALESTTTALKPKMV